MRLQMYSVKWKSTYYMIFSNLNLTMTIMVKSGTNFSYRKTIFCIFIESNAVFQSPTPPWGRQGFKPRIRPPYSPACRKRRLKGRSYMALVADTA